MKQDQDTDTQPYWIKYIIKNLILSTYLKPDLCCVAERVPQSTQTLMEKIEQMQQISKIPLTNWRLQLYV
jgi:hypothetical protein